MGMGRRQAVSHMVLVHAIGGSNPPAPATEFSEWVIDHKQISIDNEQSIIFLYRG